MRSRSATLVALAAVVLAEGSIAARVPGQQAPDVDPVFEAASIKPNRSSDAARSFRVEPGGTIQATNVTVRHLMWQAYGVQDFQIIGGPGWIGTERYDVIARAADNPTPERLRAMLRQMLVDRFGLEVEPSTSDLPVYRLVRARADGTLGPQLRPATGGCAAAVQTKGCGARVGDGTLVSQGLTMIRLAGELTGFVGRRVEDRTDLMGNFEVDLTWSPNLQTDDGRPSIFTALQEQLGLKLESAVGAVPTFVIRRVERPAEN
jgi:uncharacterized protein (TIGR03435 family)